MKSALIAGLFGLLFGIGLLISGMTDPAKVTGFLDVAGAWDPSLAFVMGGAVVVAAPLFWLARRRGRAALGDTLERPLRLEIDRKLLLGSAVFGVGWGLAGLCPGPALVSLGLDPAASLLFVAAMILGLRLGGGAERLLEGAKAPEAAPSRSEAA